MPQLRIEYLDKYSDKKVFVESGTYEGDTVQTAIDFGFEEIHSIELLDKYYEMAKERFKNYPQVKIWKGDSPDILREEIIPNLKHQATFWLDAHRSGKLEVPGSEKYGACPLVYEVTEIGKSAIKNHVIFADDHRLFDTQGWDFLKKSDYIDAVMAINSNYKFVNLDGGFSFGRQFPDDDIFLAYVE